MGVKIVIIAGKRRYQIAVILKDCLVVGLKTRLFIGLGANLTPKGFATPLAGCEAAVVMLSDLGVTVTRVSRWYESAPVPPSDQPWYLNAVAEATTSFDPAKTLTILHLSLIHI